ncbi:DUF456 domain-containing protein [Natronomonas salsuginis]|jgi:uncharacterized protein YqgC (DUF456 family)|uniref:DUF456 domain-containing protein n=1 Tax=Natronomonas salsuginis TaxID=2217661 RepID=A0A4U5JJZ4_9EURY|nr:DUF456 domain-containing protein [Natronomonas salsuginis]TKR28097.1 DUF456 domain-containing protein [Natronomonas salsuginis]
MLPIDPIVVAIILLLVGIVASFAPLIPGGAVSTLGVAYYWMVTGDLGTIAFLGFVIVGVLTVAVDLLESALSAQIGGASMRTTIVAAVAAIGLLFVLGPLGALLGVVGVVFSLEYLRHGDVRRGAQTAAVTAIGMLASTAIQVLLTVSMLVGFLLLVWV